MEISGLSASAVAGIDGKWLIESKVPAAEGAYELTFSVPLTITLKDILVGDVWLCSGQSNMVIGFDY
jgi:sialate O-acetylesterase